MLAALLLTAALAGQAAVPTGFGWDFDQTHLGSTVDIEIAGGGVTPCTNLVMTPTVDSRCTAQLFREVAQTIRVRVSKEGVSAYSDPVTVPPAGEGGAQPGVFRVTFAGELPMAIATTASRSFSGGAHILSGVAGGQAGNNIGGQATWTYAAWLKIEAAGDAGSICGIWADGSYQALLMLSSNGSVSGLVRGSFFFAAQSPPNTITPQRWQLVVLRHIGNGFSGVLSVWVDDALVAQAETTGVAADAPLPFKIGAHGSPTEHLSPLQGHLSSVGVWRMTGLSDVTLQSLRSRYPANAPPGLSFLTIKDRDEVLDYIGGMSLLNAGTAFSSDGPGGVQP